MNRNVKVISIDSDHQTLPSTVDRGLSQARINKIWAF